MSRNPKRPGTGSTVASFSSATSFYDEPQSQSHPHSIPNSNQNQARNHSQSFNSSSPPSAHSASRGSISGNNPRSSTSSSSSNSNQNSGAASGSGSSSAGRTARRSSQRIGKSFEALLASNETWVLKETVDLADDPSSAQTGGAGAPSGGSDDTFGGGMTKSSSSNMSLSLADEVATDGLEEKKKKSKRLGRRNNSRDGDSQVDAGASSLRKVLTRKPKWQEEDEEQERERQREERRRAGAGAGGNGVGSSYGSMRSVSSSSPPSDQPSFPSSSKDPIKFQASSPSSGQINSGSNIPPGRSSSSSLSGAPIGSSVMPERSPSSSTRTSSIASTANNHKFATPPEGGASPAGGVILNLPASESNGSDRRRGSDSIERKASGEGDRLSSDERDKRRSYLRAGGTASSPDLKTLVSKKMALQQSQPGRSSPIQGSHTWDSPVMSTPTQSQVASSSAAAYVQPAKDAPLPSIPSDSPALESTGRSRGFSNSNEKGKFPFPQGSSGPVSEEGGSVDSDSTANAAPPISVRQPAKSIGASTSKRGGFGASSSASTPNPPPKLGSSSKSYNSETGSRSNPRGGNVAAAPISLAQESIMSSPSLDSNPTSSSGTFKERMKKTSGFLRKLGGGGGGSSSAREREKSASKNVNSLPLPPTPTQNMVSSSTKNGAFSTNIVSKKASQASLAASEPDHNSNLMRPQEIAPVPTIPTQYASDKPTSIPPPPARGQKSASRKEKDKKDPAPQGMGLGIGMGIPNSSASSRNLDRSPSAPPAASNPASTSSNPVPPRSSSTQLPASSSETAEESGTGLLTHNRKISSNAGGSDSSGGELRSALKAWESEMDETLKESAKDLEKKTEFKPRNQWGPSPQLPDLGLEIDLEDSQTGPDGRERRERSRSFMDEEDSTKDGSINSPSSLVASTSSNHTETQVGRSQSGQNTPSLRSPGLSGSKFPWNRSKSPAGRSSSSEPGGRNSSSSTPQVSSPKSSNFEEKDYSSTLSPADLPSRKNSASPSFPGALPKERISSGSSTFDSFTSMSNPTTSNSNAGSISGPGSGFLSRDQESVNSLVGGRHLSRKETSSIAASFASFETSPETPEGASKFFTAGSNFVAAWAKEKEDAERREKNTSSLASEEGERRATELKSSAETEAGREEDDEDLKVNAEDSIRLIPKRKDSSNTSGGASFNEPEDDQPPTPLDSNFISRDSALSSATSRAEPNLSNLTESGDRTNLSASVLEPIAEATHSRDPSLVQASPALDVAPLASRSTSASGPGFRKASLDVQRAPKSSSSSTQGGEISRESSPGPAASRAAGSSGAGLSAIPLHPMERRASHASVTSLPSNVAAPTSRIPSLGVVDMDNLVENEDEATLEEAKELAMKCWNEDESFLKKEKISEWLGGIGKVNKIALVIYFSNFDFAGLRVDAAFRKLCDKLFLRAETQQVDRILHAFSQRFWHSNPESIYGSADVVHSIVFSLLLLNTDLHVADITERMTRNQFVKNTMSAISDQKLADSFTSCPSIGDDTRSSFSVNVTDHDDKSGPISPSLSAGSGLGGSLSGRNRTARRGSIRGNRSGSKDPAANNGSTPNLASTTNNNNGNSKSFSASTDEISSPPLSATRSPGRPSAPPSAAFNSGTKGRNAGASIDIDRSKYNTTSKSWEAELEMLLKEIYVAVKADQIRLPSSDRLLSPALASQRRATKASGPGSDRVSALKRGSIRGIQGLLGNNSFASEDALSQNSSIGSRSQGDSWAFQTNSSSTSPSVGSSLNPPTLGFANTLSHSIIKESHDEDLARSISETEDVDDDELALMGPPWAKEGVLTRKHYWDAPQKRAKDKAWVEVFVVVQKGTLSMFRFGADSSSTKASSAGSSAPVGGGNWLSNATALGEVPLAHALANALPPPGYNRSRPHVLALTLPGGAVYFFQAGHEDLVHEWVSTCNYWAARQSREPLAAGVSNMEYGWNKVLPSQYDEEEDLLDEREETTSIISGMSSPPDGSIYAPTTPHGPRATDTRSIRSGKSTSARSMRARGAALYQNWHEAASLVTPAGASSSRDKDNGSLYGGGASSITGSPAASMMSGGGAGSHSNERIYINEWKPPPATTVPSTLKEEEQLERCISQVKRVEAELTAHNNLRQPMLGLYGPRSSNGARALSNWERKSNYLLQELVKYQCYVDSLKSAVRMRAEKRGKREVDLLLEQADDEMSRVRQDEEGGPLKM